MSAERDLVSGVVQLSNLLLRRAAPVFERAGVTPQQWLVLAALSREETPVTLVALARRLAVTKQNMTGMMSRLEQLGFAEREGDPKDLRSYRVQLTRRGRSLVDRTQPAWEAWLASLGGEEISERDLAVLRRTVERLIARLETAR